MRKKENSRKRHRSQLNFTTRLTEGTRRAFYLYTFCLLTSLIGIPLSVSIGSSYTRLLTGVARQPASLVTNDWESANTLRPYIPTYFLFCLNALFHALYPRINNYGLWISNSKCSLHMNSKHVTNNHLVRLSYRTVTILKYINCIDLIKLSIGKGTIVKK